MNARLRSLVCLCLAQFALGSAAIFVRYALTGTGAINAAFFRVLIAAPLAIALARVTGRTLRFPPGKRRRLVAAGCLLGLHFATWIMSLQYTSVVVSTLFVCTTPFWLALQDALVKRSLPKPAVTCAFVIAALAGAAVVVTGPQATSLASDSPLGAGLALTAAILFAFYLRLMQAAQQDASTLSLIAFVYPSTLIVLAPAALIAHEPLPHTWLAWGGIIGMALVAQLIGHTALAAALRSFSSSTVSFTGLSEPPISAAAAALWLGEPLQAPVIVGALVLLLAIAVVLANDTVADERLALETPAL